MGWLSSVRSVGVTLTLGSVLLAGCKDLPHVTCCDGPVEPRPMPEACGRVTPGVADFGHVEVGTTSEPFVVDIHSDCEGTLQITDFELWGDQADSFVMGGLVDVLLRPGETTTLTLHYAPRVEDEHAIGTAWFATNGNELQIELVGRSIGW